VNVLYWIIVGLIAGAIARLVVPGRHPLGLVGTMLLGLIGALVGGFIGGLLKSGHTRFEPAGLLGAILGGILVLLLFDALSKRYPSWRRKPSGRRRIW
jgi:uncharacterized membrane protein YeaQ/YmgE (transglycosylase-associated protein family)